MSSQFMFPFTIGNSLSVPDNQMIAFLTASSSMQLYAYNDEVFTKNIVGEMTTHSTTNSTNTGIGNGGNAINTGTIFTFLIGCSCKIYYYAYDAQPYINPMKLFRNKSEVLIMCAHANKNDGIVMHGVSSFDFSVGDTISMQTGGASGICSSFAFIIDK